MIDPQWCARLVETHGRILEPGLAIYVRDGWSQIVAEMMAALELEKLHDPESQWRIVTVKEKFGELRVVSVPRPSEQARRIVDAARDSARRTCDICGAAGSMRNDGGPLRVRCDDHLL